VRLQIPEVSQLRRRAVGEFISGLPPKAFAPSPSQNSHYSTTWADSQSRNPTIGSAEEAKIEGDSLGAQQNEIVRYLKSREQLKGKIESTRFYVDAGRSAKDQNRPQLQKLRSDITKGEIDTVVCVKLDRITRSILDFADLWEFFGRHGVELISLNEDVDSTTAMGKAMLMIIMVFAQLEREVTGERTLATMQDRLSRGLWNGGCLYGYITDPKGSGKLIPDPEWVKIIQENCFDAIERLGSAGAVQRELSEKWKITVPSTNPGRGGSSGEPFSPSSRWSGFSETRSTSVGSPGVT